MSPSRAAQLDHRIAVRATVAAGGLLAVVGSASSIASGGAGSWWSGYSPFMALLSVSFAVLAWLVVSGQPRNAVTWVMAGSAFFGGLTLAGWAGAAVVGGEPSMVFGRTPVIPADLPTLAAWILVFTGPAPIVAIYGWLTFGLLLFPDGRLPSRRWRPVAVAAGVSLAAAALGSAWTYRPSSALRAESGAHLDAALVVVTVAAITSLVALIGRFRRSSGAVREQFTWVVWGTSIFVPVIIAASILGDTRHGELMPALVLAAEGILLGAYGTAVGRFRLFDLDLVISRTVVYGTLAAVIAGAYVLVVVGIAELLGSGPEPNPVVAISVTAAVAAAAQPLRRHVQRAANRMVYGKKATPYEVLSEFSRSVAAAGDSLRHVAKSLVDGTGARRCTVWVGAGDRLVEVAAWPESGDDVGDSMSFPIEQDGALLGGLTLAAPAGQRLSDEDRRLAGDVASGLGLALQNRRLTEALQARIEELRASRHRLVAVQDETRRQLERDLHDGAQQQLVSLKVKLGLAESIAGKASGARTAELLHRLNGEADVAVDLVRDLARRVYPPLLEDEGLPSAIAAQLQLAPLPVTMQADGIGRYDRHVEATAYFCVSEALRNVAEHAEASRGFVRLAHVDRALTFEVSDNGRGFDPDMTPRGGGLTDIADRVAALGGRLVIESAPDRGTAVRATLPGGVRP